MKSRDLETMQQLLNAKQTPVKRQTKEPITKRTKERLSQMGWTRKPSGYDEVYHTISGSDSALTEIPEFSAHEALDKHWNILSLVGDRQYFIIKTGNAGRFLVDTQGAGYPRYMQRIVEDK
jgi:hypothetical protein